MGEVERAVVEAIEGLLWCCCWWWKERSLVGEGEGR